MGPGFVEPDTKAVSATRSGRCAGPCMLPPFDAVLPPLHATSPSACPNRAQNCIKSPGWKGDGGEGGIRTHGRLAPTPDFESGTFDHSATSPWARIIPAKRPSITAFTEESIGHVASPDLLPCPGLPGRDRES